MDIAGYVASIFIGISLGLIGGGGSILTVPVLVYLFKIDAFTATTYSLFIVGATSVAGSFSYFKKQLINIKTAIIFGIPSIISVFITRLFILPIIPNIVFKTNGFILNKHDFLLIFFAILMIIASYSMIKKTNNENEESITNTSINYSTTILIGLVVGFFTGLVGAGGGFLIIPALVNLLKLSIKKAIGTSLFIISINSLAGFIFSLNHTFVNWKFLILIAFIAIIGILIGSFLSTKIDGKKLKPAFGWFVLVMGIYIILKETML